MRRTWRAALLCAAACLLAAPAHATYHIMVIDQVFFGFPQAPGAQYVMLRTEAPLQTVVHAQPFSIADATGSPVGAFATFCPTHGTCDLPKVSPACAGGGCPSALNSNGSRILAATPWAAGLFCVTPDVTATQVLPYPDGRVCWADCALNPQPGCTSGPVDCVAYGQFTGDNGIFGMPAAAAPLGQALVGSPLRQNQFLGTTLLDDAMGFSAGTPAPQNFHGDSGALDGLAGDPEGSGTLAADNVDAEVGALFQADHRCDLPAMQRGADANLDTRVSAADVVATIQIVTASM